MRPAKEQDAKIALALAKAGRAGAGTVTAVTASAPLASSGGATPNITLIPAATAGQILNFNGVVWAAVPFMRLGVDIPSAADGDLAQSFIKISTPGVRAHVVLMRVCDSPSIIEDYWEAQNAGVRFGFCTFGIDGTDPDDPGSCLISSEVRFRWVLNTSPYPHPDLMSLDPITGLFGIGTDPGGDATLFQVNAKGGVKAANPRGWADNPAAVNPLPNPSNIVTVGPLTPVVTGVFQVSASVIIEDVSGANNTWEVEIVDSITGVVYHPAGHSTALPGGGVTYAVNVDLPGYVLGTAVTFTLRILQIVGAGKVSAHSAQMRVVEAITP